MSDFRELSSCRRRPGPARALEVDNPRCLTYRRRHDRRRLHPALAPLRAGKRRAQAARALASAADAVSPTSRTPSLPGEKQAAREAGRGGCSRGAGGRGLRAGARQRRRHDRGTRTTSPRSPSSRSTALVLPKATPEAVAALGAERTAGDRDRRDRPGPAPRLRDGGVTARRGPRARRRRPRARARARAAGRRAGDPLRALVARRRLRRGRASARRSTVVYVDVRDDAGLEASAGSRARSGCAARRASIRRRSTS